MSDEPDLKSYVVLGTVLGLLALVCYVGLVPAGVRESAEYTARAVLDGVCRWFWEGLR